MSTYLLDTNHLGAALRPKGSVQGRIIGAAKEGHRIGTCVPVLCELGVGIAQTSRPDDNWKALEALLQRVRVLPIEPELARTYADVYRELRAKGRVLSQVDMMLAALGRHNNLIVLTTDGDFKAVRGLKTESWIG